MSGYVSLDLVRQNYHVETEAKVNEQINLELKAFLHLLVNGQFPNLCIS